MRRSLYKRYADVTKGRLRWRNLLAAIELLPAGSPDGVTELAGLLSELVQSRDTAAVAELAALAKHPRYRRILQAEQAHLTVDVEVAQQIYWKLHQEGYSFPDRLFHVSDRLIEAKHPERAVAVMEAAIRSGARLSRLDQLTLAKAYELSRRPLEAKRVLSDEPR